ncbi:unnamed protein product [Mytilus edulis]|uniref:Uncharacterized protein n=1 Tax=Mytilus edulis TaxID=6550 RepID=A0A8S3QWU0_MYTED|nr:unnamed protein product [Mytilus edulis]
MQLQTCLNVFTDIEIKFACNDYDNKTYGEDHLRLLFIVKQCVLILENFTVSYPYDNGTLDVIHNCSSPIIVDMKPLYQSNYANWSYCEDISKNALPNCSVACIKNICSINTRCINIIDPRCLIPKYMDMYIRMIYECVHHSKVYPERKEDDLFHVDIGCGSGWIINISDVSLQQIEYACSKYEYSNECLISGEDKSRIINECSNKNNCSMSIKLNITCDNVKTYAFYNVSYNCSKSGSNTNIGISACQMVNETTHIQCHNGRSIQEQSLSINFQPAHVASCLQEHNISWNYENDCRKQNKSKCEINLFKGMLLHQCLVVPKRKLLSPIAVLKVLFA